MSRSVRTLSGPKARKYFTDLLAAAPGVPEAAVQRVSSTLESEVVMVKVRPSRRPSVESAPLLPFPDLPLMDSTPAAESARDGEEPASADAPAETVSTNGPVPDEEDHDDTGAPALAPAAAFDPFEFSLIVELTKSGPEGLMRRLAVIESADDLRSLAKAQHISLSASLVEPAQIRAAILAGTERRIADRRAAAS